MSGPLSLALFMSRYGSLEAWERNGILGREMALYRALTESGVRIALVSYGRAADRELIAGFPGIELFHNRWGLPNPLYERLAPFLHGRPLGAYAVFKTNQINGGLTALRAARAARRPLIARMGYLWSQFEAEAHGRAARPARRARAVEGRVLAGAAAVVVTTAEMRAAVLRAWPELAERLRVIPNYVDTERFRPALPPQAPEHVVFVGRFGPQKNLPALLDAARLGGWRVRLAGSGPDEPALRARVADLGAQVEWLGRLNHEALPDILAAGGAMFVLPSWYEGHPKALIEAMACGLPVIGADRPGIREVIQHERTGLLCEPTAEGIQLAVARLRAHPDFARALGEAARRHAVAQYSLAKVVTEEQRLIQELGAGTATSSAAPRYRHRHPELRSGR